VFMKKKLKKVIPNNMKKYLINLYNEIYYWPTIKCLKKVNTEKRIILIGTPEHGNLGDHLIAKGELEYFNRNFNDYKIIEITGGNYRHNNNKLLNLIKKDDIIAITGGGFLGSLWIKEEEMVRDVIEKFPENKIIIFPSTIYFEKSTYGNTEFNKSREIYRKHKDLKICVRDANSINMAKILLDGNEDTEKVIFTPDIALYLDNYESNHIREHVTFCLREDKEKILSTQIENSLKKSVVNKGYSIKTISTVIPKKVRIEDREKELDELILEFQTSKLVITDRLHGMIFAAITGTPCIALDNKSGKVKGVYEWIKDLEYIVFLEDTDDISATIDNLLKMENIKFDNSGYIQRFNKISELTNRESINKK